MDFSSSKMTFRVSVCSGFTPTSWLLRLPAILNSFCSNTFRSYFLAEMLRDTSRTRLLMAHYNPVTKRISKGSNPPLKQFLQCSSSDPFIALNCRLSPAKMLVGAVNNKRNLLASLLAKIFYPLRVSLSNLLVYVCQNHQTKRVNVVNMKQ